MRLKGIFQELKKKYVIHYIDNIVNNNINTIINGLIKQ